MAFVVFGWDMAGDLHLCDRQVCAGMCAMRVTRGQHQQHLHQHLPLKQRKKGDVQLQYIKYSFCFLLFDQSTFIFQRVISVTVWRSDAGP